MRKPREEELRDLFNKHLRDFRNDGVEQSQDDVHLDVNALVHSKVPIRTAFEAFFFLSLPGYAIGIAASIQFLGLGALYILGTDHTALVNVGFRGNASSGST
jgi:hypothetical protein